MSTGDHMNTTKKIATIAVFTALYFVLSALLKIPVVGHITLDLGYIALAVGAVYLGAVPAMLIGSIGAFLESALMSQRGVSLGWILMNAIVGYSCGLVLHKAVDGERKKFWTKAILVVTLSMLVGVVVKTLIDCALYKIALVAKIPSSAAAWVLDSLVMLVIGMPLSLALKKRLKSLTGE